MNNIYKLRLDLLTVNFRDKANLNKTYNKFLRLTDPELKELLRDHNKKPIETTKEVSFRDDIDFLIGYYSILMTGILCNYIKPEFSENLLLESRSLLDNKWVKKYYQKYYPLELPDMFRKIFLDSNGFKNNQERDLERNKATDVLFERFLMAYRSRIEDNDIDTFLFILDDGYYYDDEFDMGVDIDKLWKTLGSSKKLKELQKEQNSSSILYSAIWGFAKFVTYLEEYAIILHELNNDTLSQSAIWHLEAYWFKQMKDKLGKALNKGLNNVLTVLNEGYYVHLNPSEKIEEEIEKIWKENSINAIEEAKTNIDFLMNSKLEKPVKMLSKQY